MRCEYLREDIRSRNNGLFRHGMSHVAYIINFQIIVSINHKTILAAHGVNVSQEYCDGCVISLDYSSITPFP